MTEPQTIDHVPTTVAPSFYQLPQDCTVDRKRARRATIAATRERFVLETAVATDGLPPLPGYVATLPKEVAFPVPRMMSFATGKLLMQINSRLALFAGPAATRYERLYRLMAGPKDAIVRWRDDMEFARQRLSGVNPMALRRCDDMPAQALVEAANSALQAWGPRTPDFADLVRNKRAFLTDYGVLLDPDVQQYKKNDGRSLMYAPLALYGLDALDRLRPLAIAVRKPDGTAPIATPNGDQGRWLLARGHAQSADAQLHEAYYHLFETHLVNETIALCMYRNLYPEHPVRQLLEQHYEYNLAIDSMARGNLLKVGGPIDLSMPGGVVGAMAAARATARTFDLRERTLQRDLEVRGMLDIPDYPYREDAQRVREGLHRYVRGVMAPWYRTSADVIADYELRAWLEEVATAGGLKSCPTLADTPDAGIDGVAGALPARIGSPEQLFEVLTDFIFRAAPQHAAVNNGQYDAYGYIPNTPGTFASDLTDALHIDEDAYFAGLPLKTPAMAQMGMVWVLSMPTVRSLLHTGDCGAFQASVCREAAESVAAFRRRMHDLSDVIALRNLSRAVPYRYLDPRNISRSTDI